MKRKQAPAAAKLFAAATALCCGLILPGTASAQYENYRCGNNDKKVQICHIPPGNPDNAHEICVGEPAVEAHLAHGDVLGACPVSNPNPDPNPGPNPIAQPASGDLYENYRCGNDDKKVQICHIPPGNPDNAHEICVGEPSVEAHLAHGDVLGACPTSNPNPGPNPITKEEMEADLGNTHSMIVLPANGFTVATK